MTSQTSMLLLKPSVEYQKRGLHFSDMSLLRTGKDFSKRSFRIDDLLNNNRKSLETNQSSLDREYTLSPTRSISPAQSLSPPGNRGQGFPPGSGILPMSSRPHQPNLLPSMYQLNPFFKLGLNVMNQPQANYFMNRTPDLFSLYPPLPFSLPNYGHLPLFLRDRLLQYADIGSGSRKCRRSRTVFSEVQLIALEKRFAQQKYLSTPDRMELADALGLSQLQVKTWYQNRRMKWKKQVQQTDSSTESEHDVTASNRAKDNEDNCDADESNNYVKQNKVASFTHTPYEGAPIKFESPNCRDKNKEIKVMQVIDKKSSSA